MKKSKKLAAFREFEGKYYEFHRFFLLVQEYLITPQDLHITNDIGFEIVYKAWKRSAKTPIVGDDLYEELAAIIMKDKKLIRQLQEANEG